MKKEQTSRLRRTAKEIEQERKHKQKKKLKLWLIFIAVAVIIISVISLLIFWSATNKSEKGQIEDLNKAIQNKNAGKLSKMIKSNGDDLPISDANHIINYLNQKNIKNHYEKEIKEIESTIENGNQSDSTLGEITDKSGKPILTISKDGVSSFIFKKVAITPHYRNVYIEGKNNDATYQFENKGKQTNAVSSNKQTKLGRFMVGEYNISANKYFKDTKVDIDDSVSGNLHINTDDINSDGKVIAKEEFPQAWFKVELSNTKDLDNDYNLYINDKPISYEKNQTYGKYPTDIPLKVRATGKIDNKTINANEVEVKSNTDDSTQTIHLKFDEKAINRELKKEKDVKKEAESFMKDYTEDLNKAYKKSRFTGLKRYFKDIDSDVANNIKRQVQSDKVNHYSNPKILSSKKEGEELTLILRKKDNKTDKMITSRYVLEFNKEENPKFKIKSYTDV